MGQSLPKWLVIAESAFCPPGPPAFARDASKAAAPKPSGRRRAAVRELEHDPEKACPALDAGWVPVFPRDKREAFARRSCSNKKIERDDGSKKSHPALAVPGSSTGRRIKNNREDSMPTFTRLFTCFATAAAFALVAAQPAQAQSADTSFFLTSIGIGNGGNLGGLAGADNYCQTLAQAVGAN